MKQLTFDFLDDLLIDGKINEYKWTKMSPNQWVKTTYTRKWTTEIYDPFQNAYGNDDGKTLEHHEEKVEEVWTVRLLPVLVSPSGYYFKLPFEFETINKIE